MGSVVINGAISTRRKQNKTRLPKPPSYVDRYAEFQKANTDYEQMFADFEKSLNKDQLGMLLKLKAKANEVQIKWHRCESVKKEDIINPK